MSANERPLSKVSVVFDQPLPNVPGKSMRGVIVDYAPGAASPSHRHPKSAFIYATVLEGKCAAASMARQSGPARSGNTGMRRTTVSPSRAREHPASVAASSRRDRRFTIQSPNSQLPPRLRLVASLGPSLACLSLTKNNKRIYPCSTLS
ncbi:hypothetical protein H681_14665 [Pseudomonas sp. ATCC 13867]|nr:hypothetical protein H681_14665 [Pseudomonas sp. ATCC 13867]